MKVQITEYLHIDLEKEAWCCNRCGTELGPARENYKIFLLVAERNPTEVHPPYVDPQPGGFTFSPDPEWCRLIEFYCPNCGSLLEVEYLPPGHPLTHDIEIDLDALKAKFLTPPISNSAAENGEASGNNH
jgi:acetone carboxylase gamma subunit